MLMLPDLVEYIGGPADGIVTSSRDVATLEVDTDLDTQMTTLIPLDYVVEQKDGKMRMPFYILQDTNRYRFKEYLFASKEEWKRSNLEAKE
jgi:hypothetical protein